MLREIPKKVLKTERLRETTSRELEIMMLVADRAPPDLAVVKLYAIVETESMIYIVMELAEHGNLSTFLKVRRRRACSLRQALAPG